MPFNFTFAVICSNGNYIYARLDVDREALHDPVVEYFFLFDAVYIDYDLSLELFRNSQCSIEKSNRNRNSGTVNRNIANTRIVFCLISPPPYI
jgi:hypothetical protein